MCGGQVAKQKKMKCQTIPLQTSPNLDIAIPLFMEQSQRIIRRLK